MKKYQSPDIDLILLVDTDILTISLGSNDIEEDRGENDGEWVGGDWT